MAADDLIMEALARIEHKQDLILEIVAKLGNVEGLPKVADPAVPCVLCGQSKTYSVDISKSVVVRKCGCSTGKIALDLNAFAPPTPTKKTEKDDGTGTNEEDRYDSFGRRRNQ